ncbi:MAG: DUF4956 domain-containing protein [Gemmataceae bacterium]
MLEWFEKIWGWLQKMMGPEYEFSASAMAVRLVIAFLLGVGVAVLHAAFRAGDGRRTHGLGTSIILLTILVAMVIFVIGESQARAFGLVGALAIIRFRTPISDTRDTCFVIFAVVMGMAVGARQGYYQAAWVALPVIGIACLLIRVIGRPPAMPGRLKLRLSPGIDADALLHPALNKTIARYSLERSTTGKTNGVTLAYKLWLCNGTDPAALVDGLRSKPGVQKASWADR